MQLQWLYRIALGLYACTLTYLFFYGPRGWRDMYALQAQIDTSRVQTAEKQALVTQLTTEEQEWQTNSFKKERVAREELQMARAGDTVYYY
jgi:cell division protein FtsB